jgi:DNA (cytosine-5)-methyltransferase 1
LRYLSVCSGIEAATVAMSPYGWQAAAFAEIEKFPSRVLQHHYPDVPNLGDLNDYKSWPDFDIDVLVGGTPCQSYSVAGLREGLDDPRGQLMLTYLAVADRFKPTWVWWENVPGALSSNGGRDFGALLGALAELGYGWAYRVLDAQYVRVDGYPRAVPQRRRRVFVVGHLGDWRRAAAVLFEPESLRGLDPPTAEAPVSVCLTARGAGSLDDRETYVVTPTGVRRLTPTECERLQGFPDNYTDIGNGRGGPTPDGPRYKALGNSMAVNVMRWIGRRMQDVKDNW